MNRPGEFDLIARYFAPLATDLGAFELTDDAAVITQQSGLDTVVTTDAVVAGIHFLPDQSPASIAKKALRVNLSDLAAMGADPRGYTLALALPDEINEGWVGRFASGLAEDQEAYGLSLFGGDTVRTSGPLTISITAIGTVPAGRALQRKGAAPGDHIYVSGTIGDAWLGLSSLSGDLEIDDAAAREFVEDRYLHPSPRMELGARLIGIAAACLDVSDGLIGDLEHICEASGCGARVNADKVPTSPASEQIAQNTLAGRLSGGDDYELLFALAPDRSAMLEAMAAEVGVAVSRIGDFTDGRGVSVLDAEGRELPLPKKSWRHF